MGWKDNTAWQCHCQGDKEDGALRCNTHQPAHCSFGSRCARIALSALPGAWPVRWNLRHRCLCRHCLCWRCCWPSLKTARIVHCGGSAIQRGRSGTKLGKHTHVYSRSTTPFTPTAQAPRASCCAAVTRNGVLVVHRCSTPLASINSLSSKTTNVGLIR